MIAVSITTINMPSMLKTLCENICKYGHEDYVTVVVTGDHKTPATVSVYLQELRHRMGVELVWMGVAQQKEFIEEHGLGDLDAYIGWNTLGRRNFGDLWALQEGAQVIIRMDDDNYPQTSSDFIKEHDVRKYDVWNHGRKHHGGPVLWIDPVTALYRHAEVRHRGMPHDPTMRAGAGGWDVVEESPETPVWINEGLWVGELDVDAYERINRTVVKWDLPEHELCLATNRWAPMNSQNTAFHRAIMPAAFLNPALGRYDDIWCSYVCRRVMDQMGVSALFGKPIVAHLQNRTMESVWDDLRLEIDGLKYTPDLIRWLEKWNYPKDGISVSELTERMAEDLTEEDNRLFQEIGTGLKTWIAALRKLNLDFPA